MTKSKYEVNIDFDEASRAWRRNKINTGLCFFRYCCGFIKKNGKPCKAPPRHWAKSLRPKDGSFQRTWGLCRHHFKMAPPSAAR